MPTEQRVWIIASRYSHFLIWQDKHPDSKGVYASSSKDLLGRSRDISVKQIDWFEAAYRKAGEARLYGYKVEDDAN